MKTVRASPGTEFHKTPAIGRFGKYKAEGGQDVRAPIVKNDQALERFMDILQRLECDSEDESLFHRIEPLIAGFRCTADDIRRFILMLPAYRDTTERLEFKAGSLLSMLINNSEDAGFLIPLKDISIPLQWIGYKCPKHILIVGDAGDSIGGEMQGGRLVVDGNVDRDVGLDASGCDILVKGNAGVLAGRRFSGKNLIIKGNAGAYAGYGMTGGVLRIDGDADICVGTQMKGGSIDLRGNAVKGVGDWMRGGIVHVKGNAGAKVGERMEGGIIRVDGEIESIGDVKGGKIFHKGKLIVDLPDVKE